MSSLLPQHVEHEFAQTNDAPPERVFPLLCPVREADWLAGWKYRLVHSQSGIAERGCVFTTPGENGTETVWLCTEYLPEQFAVSYAWVRPGHMTALLTIRLQPFEDEKTRARIRYAYTALSEAGQKELQTMDRAWFEQKMKFWEGAINHYLRTGKCLR